MLRALNEYPAETPSNTPVNTPPLLTPLSTPPQIGAPRWMAVPGALDSTSVRGEGDAGSQAAAAVAKAPSVKLTTTSPYHNSKRDVLVKMTVSSM